MNFMLGLISFANHITQLFCLGAMFNIFLVFISILRSTINVILSKLHSIQNA